MNISRQTHLDSLRGIAAVIVVITHYLCAFYPYTVFGTQASYQSHSSLENIFFFPPFGLFVAGHFAVCLFFILSGYVLSYSFLGESDKTYKLLASIVKRPIRLGGLVWASMILGFIFWCFGLFQNYSVSKLTFSEPWFSSFWSSNADFSKFFMDLMTASFSKGNVYNPPLWTIKIELYGSIMVYLYLLLVSHFKYRILISILLFILFKDTLYQGFWIGVIVADIMKNYNIPRVFKISVNKYYFYTLMAIFIYISSYPNYVSQHFLLNTLYFFLPDDKGFGGGYPMLSAFLIFVLAGSSLQLKKYLNHPVLLFFGNISYGLYVIHFLVLGSLSSVLFLYLKDSIGYNTSFLIVFFSGFPMIVLAAFILTKYVDNPSIRLAQYVGNKTISCIDCLRELILSVYKKLITKA